MTPLQNEIGGWLAVGLGAVLLVAMTGLVIGLLIGLVRILRS